MSKLEGGFNQSIRNRRGKKVNKRLEGQLRCTLAGKLTLDALSDFGEQSGPRSASSRYYKTNHTRISKNIGSKRGRTTSKEMGRMGKCWLVSKKFLLRQSEAGKETVEQLPALLTRRERQEC